MFARSKRQDVHDAAAEINRRQRRKLLRVLSKNFPASGSRHSRHRSKRIWESCTGWRTTSVNRVTTDAGTPTRVATIVKPMSAPIRNEPPAWQTPASPKRRRPRASTPRSQRSDPLYGRNTRRRRRYVAITHLGAGQATKEDRTSGPSPPSGPPNWNTGRSTDWLSK